LKNFSPARAADVLCGQKDRLTDITMRTHGVGAGALA